MSSGKSGDQARSDIETIGPGTAAASSSRAWERAHRRRSHLRNQRRGGGLVVERFALVVDRGGGHAGFDQVDPPAVHDLVVGRAAVTATAQPR